MITMSELTSADQLTIRSAPGPSLALERVVLRARAAGIRYKKRRVSKEAVANAAFLFLDSMDDRSLADLMERAVRHLEAVLGGHADSGASGPTVIPEVPASRTAPELRRAIGIRKQSDREADDPNPPVAERKGRAKRSKG